MSKKLFVGVSAARQGGFSSHVLPAPVPFEGVEVNEMVVGWDDAVPFLTTEDGTVEEQSTIFAFKFVKGFIQSTEGVVNGEATSGQTWNASQASILELQEKDFTLEMWCEHGPPEADIAQAIEEGIQVVDRSVTLYSLSWGEQGGVRGFVTVTATRRGFSQIPGQTDMNTGTTAVVRWQKNDDNYVRKEYASGSDLAGAPMHVCAQRSGNEFYIYENGIKLDPVSVESVGPELDPPIITNNVRLQISYFVLGVETPTKVGQIRLTSNAARYSINGFTPNNLPFYEPEE